MQQKKKLKRALWCSFNRYSRTIGNWWRVNASIKKILKCNKSKWDFYVADSLTGHDDKQKQQHLKEKLEWWCYFIKIWWWYKGGVALSISHQVEVPLRFIGIGEKMPDLEVFILIELFQDFRTWRYWRTCWKTSAIIDEKKQKKLLKKIKKRSI